MSLKFRLSSILLVLLLTASCAQKQIYMHPTETVLTPIKDMALVRFIIPRTASKIFDGDKFIGEPHTAMLQFDYYAKPGRHLFVTKRYVWIPDGGFVEADLEAGKTYYILVKNYSMGYVRWDIVPVNTASKYWSYVKEWEKTLKKYEIDHEALKEGDKINKPLIKKMILQYETELKKKHDWPKIHPADGF